MAAKGPNVSFSFDGAVFELRIEKFENGIVVEAGNKLVALHKEGNRVVAKEVPMR
jgi:hypothetical protein